MGEGLDRLKSGQDLASGQMGAFMRGLMRGDLADELIVDFLTALKEKGESIAEIVEAARVMREHAVELPLRKSGLLDTCGTGGDGAGTINVSTLAALAAAAAGVPVAKHGNRAVSSKSGSADFLKAMGISAELKPELVAASIEKTNFGFMFAPVFHPSMKFAAGARKKMKTRTIFNCLGPLTNPAGAKRQLIGVYDAKLVPILAQSLGELGSEHVLVVHGDDGLDEVSVSGPTQVAEFDGSVRTYKVCPEDFGVQRSDRSALVCEDADSSVAAAKKILAGKKGPMTDFVLLNTAFALKAAGRINDIREGVRTAGELFESGAVSKKIEEIKDFVNGHVHSG